MFSLAFTEQHKPVVEVLNILEALIKRMHIERAYLERGNLSSWETGGTNTYQGIKELTIGN